MLTSRFAGEYNKLLEDNQELISKAMEVQTLVASLRSGKVDSRTLVKQVSNSSLIKDKDRAKIDGVMGQVDAVLSGQIPPSLQKKIPAIPGNLPLQPGILPIQSGNLPQQLGSFKSLLPARPKQKLTEPKTKP